MTAQRLKGHQRHLRTICPPPLPATRARPSLLQKSTTSTTRQGGIYAALAGALAFSGVWPPAPKRRRGDAASHMSGGPSSCWCVDDATFCSENVIFGRQKRKK